MILSAHQPAYLPWCGYLQKIAACDVFIFMDDVQFEKNSFINRNKIKTASGPVWLTVPVRLKGHTDATIRTTYIDTSVNWKKKHLDSIYFNYKKCHGFERKFIELTALYDGDYATIADLCWHQLGFWLEKFNISSQLIKQSSLDLVSRKSDLVLDFCRRFEAERYISGPLGKDYLNEDEFHHAGIKIEYFNFSAEPYPQQWGDFIPNLSVVDYWFNSATAHL